MLLCLGGLLQIVETADQNQQCACDYIPRDGLGEDQRGQRDGHNGLDEKCDGGSGRVGQFDGLHVAHVAEAGDDDTHIEQDPNAVYRDAGEDGFAAEQQDQKLHYRAQQKAETVLGEAADLIDPLFAQGGIESEADRGRQHDKYTLHAVSVEQIFRIGHNHQPDQA